MIRPYQKKDLPFLLDILILNTPTFFHIDEVNDYKDHIELHADQYYTVLDQHDTVIGGCGYFITDDPGTAQISWIFFNPEVQGKGHGRMAVNHCLTQIRKIRLVTLVIVHTSQLAYRFFEKFGFILRETKADFWGPGLDYYKMDLEL